MTGKEIIGGLAVLLNIGNSAFYLWQIFRRGIKPHAFSWIIWGTLALVVFAAQYAVKAGPGCWVMGTSFLLCYLVGGIGLFYGEKRITRGDWLAFIFSLSAIPVWIVTSNPLWAVIIATVIDAVSFYPTFRKSWLRPHEEGAIVFSIYSLQMLLSLIALENYNLTTVLDPAFVFVTNALLVLLLIYRRRILA